VEDAVLGAARALLIEKGLAGCTIAAVAQRAGVGKGTIYLRWPDRESLVVDALGEVMVVVSEPDTGSVRGDLLAILDEVTESLRGEGGPLLAATLSELPRYAKLRALYEERVMMPVVAIVREVVARATRRREIRKVNDITLVTDMIFSPLVIRVLVWQQPIPAAMPGALVDTLLDGLRPR
jgi:AcrR family transcriptional regulator